VSRLGRRIRGGLLVFSRRNGAGGCWAISKKNCPCPAETAEKKNN